METANQEPVTTTGRIVTVVTTRGQKTEIQFDGSLWGDLRKKVIAAGFSLSSMKCVEGVKRNTLEHEKAVVPDGNFRLFLMPLKSKSGVKAAKDGAAKKAKAAPKKAATKAAAKKATPKKAAAKTAAKKVAAKKSPKKAVAKQDNNGVADVVESVKQHKVVEQPAVQAPEIDAHKELEDLAKGFADVRL